MVAARYWWEYDSNINFFTGSEQMREGVNVIFMDIKIRSVSGYVIIFILNMRWWTKGKSSKRNYLKQSEAYGTAYPYLYRTVRIENWWCLYAQVHLLHCAVPCRSDRWTSLLVCSSVICSQQEAVEPGDAEQAERHVQLPLPPALRNVSVHPT